MDVIQFIKDKNLIGDDSLSIAQETGHRAFYGLPMTDEQEAIFRQCTGFDYTPGRPYMEADFICGRRSGKSDRLASNIALYEAFEGGHEKHLSVGEKAYIIIISVNKKQAGLILSYIKGKINRSPILQSMVVKETAEEVQLRNGIIIGSYPCSYRTLRGFSIPLAIIDEAAFLRVEGINVDKEVIEAIRPAMAQFPNGKLIKISTPYAKQGVLWEEYSKYYGKADAPVLIWQAPTSLMNPTISAEFLKREEARDPETFKREYLAQFSDSISDFIPSDAVDNCVVTGRYGLPYQKKWHYTAALDAAFKGDAFTFALCHSEDNKIVFDRLESWRGTKDKPVQLKGVIDEIAAILAAYNTHVIHGDQYCAEPIRQAFVEKGIGFLETPFTSGFKKQIFSTLKHRIIAGEVELLDHPRSIRELKTLEARITQGGNIQIGHPRLMGYSDDFAVVIALTSYKVRAFDSMLSGITDRHLFRLPGRGEGENRVSA
ncbi:MAG: hypothetical protein DRH11_07635 [Deltaproteobacteria bacterium]|mgnify:CR=1 FL=1|nr:MAG: hypothetical protein DRH11_07635 [Deltaproteobacteria bacterium]